MTVGRTWTSKHFFFALTTQILLNIISWQCTLYLCMYVLPISQLNINIEEYGIEVDRESNTNSHVSQSKYVPEY